MLQLPSLVFCDCIFLNHPEKEKTKQFIISVVLLVASQMLPQGHSALVVMD